MAIEIYLLHYPNSTLAYKLPKRLLKNSFNEDIPQGREKVTLLNPEKNEILWPLGCQKNDSLAGDMTFLPVVKVANEDNLKLTHSS